MVMQSVLMKMGFQLAIFGVLMYMMRGMTLDDIQTDIVAKVQEQLSIKRWLAQEVPWYQSYMKSGLTMYLLYYMLQIPTVPTLVMAKTPFNEMLTGSCPVLTRKYWPSVWMPSATLQNWVYHLLVTLRQSYEDPAAKWTRDKLLTKDGHGITIDMLDDERLSDAAHVVLIITSSMSGSHAYETFTYAEQMRAKGYRVYALNQRGAANAPLKTAGGVPIAFNTLSGMGDLRETVNWLAKRHKGRRLTLVSFGTACAMLLNYLNTESKRAPVDSAVCISPAMVMESIAELGFVENRMELKRLKREVLRRHADELEAVLGEEKMLEADAATTVARFHELVTMQVCGDEPDDEMRYSDYLKAHSLTSLGDGIERPVLFICSKDDPVYRFKEVLPAAVVKQFKKHPHCLLLVAAHAGHNCMFESFFATNWASRVSHQFAHVVAVAHEQQRLHEQKKK